MGGECGFLLWQCSGKECGIVRTVWALAVPTTSCAPKANDLSFSFTELRTSFALFCSSDSCYHFSKRGSRLSMVAYACNPIISEVEQEDHEFKASLSYTVDLRLACVVWDPVSKTKWQKQWSGSHNLAHCWHVQEPGKNINNVPDLSNLPSISTWPHSLQWELACAVSIP